MDFHELILNLYLFNTSNRGKKSARRWRTI